MKLRDAFLGIIAGTLAVIAVILAQILEHVEEVAHGIGF